MKKENLVFATVQSVLHWEDKEANLSMFSEKIAGIHFDCDAVILPEMFSTGFTMHAKDLAEDMDGPTMDWIRTMANENKKIITGSFIAVENGKYFNRLIWMNPDGSFQKYDKKHLFRMAGEDGYYSAGNEVITIEYKGWKIRPFICYDLRFPAWCRNRNIVKDGKAIPEFDVMFYVANWPEARSMPWDVLLRARAIENQVYCIGVNRVGKDGNDIPYNGHSAALNAKGEYLIGPIDDQEEISRIEIDFESLQQFREKFPQGLDADSFELT